jgi:hypothetical protein
VVIHSFKAVCNEDTVYCMEGGNDQSTIPVRTHGEHVKCISSLLWDVFRWEHAREEGVEQNKGSLGLESGDCMASSPHRRKREASLVLLNVASNLQPPVSDFISKIQNGI